jgi:hypothetical protein
MLVVVVVVVIVIAVFVRACRYGISEMVGGVVGLLGGVGIVVWIWLAFRKVRSSSSDDVAEGAFNYRRMLKEADTLAMQATFVAGA